MWASLSQARRAAAADARLLRARVHAREPSLRRRGRTGQSRDRAARAARAGQAGTRAPDVAVDDRRGAGHQSVPAGCASLRSARPREAHAGRPLDGRRRGVRGAAELEERVRRLVAAQRDRRLTLSGGRAYHRPFASRRRLGDERRQDRISNCGTLICGSSGESQSSCSSRRSPRSRAARRIPSPPPPEPPPSARRRAECARARSRAAAADRGATHREVRRAERVRRGRSRRSRAAARAGRGSLGPDRQGLRDPRPRRRPLVEKWERYYAERPDYVARMIDRSRRYLYHIVNEIDAARHAARHRAAADDRKRASTRRRCRARARRASGSSCRRRASTTGSQQNFWFDSRRDVIAATDKALDYLQKLHGDFGDWQLALAGVQLGRRQRRARDGSATRRGACRPTTRRWHAERDAQLPAEAAGGEEHRRASRRSTGSCSPTFPTRRTSPS